MGHKYPEYEVTDASAIVRQQVNTGATVKQAPSADFIYAGQGHVVEEASIHAALREVNDFAVRMAQLGTQPEMLYLAAHVAPFSDGLSGVRIPDFSALSTIAFKDQQNFTFTVSGQALVVINYLASDTGPFAFLRTEAGGPLPLLNVSPVAVEEFELDDFWKRTYLSGITQVGVTDLSSTQR